MSETGNMVAIRRLDEAERALLTTAWEATRAHLPHQPEIHWLNLFLNRSFRVDFPEQAALDAWVQRTLAAVYPTPKHILSYGFIVNPAGSTRTQLFHCDYSYTSSNLFVPLTPVTLENATQFIRQPLRVARMDEVDMIGTLEHLLEVEGVDALEVCQLVCRPFTLIHLLPNTPHRGIPNREAYDRVMLWITVDDTWRPLREHAVFQLKETKADFADWTE